MTKLQLSYEHSRGEGTVSLFVQSDSAIMELKSIPCVGQYRLFPVWLGVTQMATIQTTRSLSQAIIDAFKDLVSKIDGVSAAYLKVRGDSFSIWTIIDRDDTALMRQVFKAEFELMDRFPDPEFDFRVIPKDIFSPPETFTQIL
ncbi:hypothetical protein HKBW3S44_01308 [Candidatus Hakubella thermalkaliphila]|uniref:Uncharacterized protein n=2 Tax=Candidatus Hakubella thermalkaliphila TaxID=2754717 RepID=A0A6V8Q5U0_9ACTN|nr:hypothetical protein HKBW3S34_01701 [Candidatus Hakubella thermalkaliphila]GFP37631.1 hypothetical protein HKBW3S44_01308 [Candidatus Hakubella thermalkaliphila]GFP40098.1 hypothetical protein HKBW3S47_01796 [Candidatus Hakubella thermalkaliphila]GFP41052.1 hypothetical protein HKBW3C_00178 [Candidatus Hakubella thermalkaliphila]